MTLYGISLSLAALLFVFEFQNVLSRRRGLVLELAETGCEDFTIIVPVYGDPAYFKNAENLLPWRDRVLLVFEVSNAQMMSFADHVERQGWEVFRTVQPKPVSVPKLIAAALPSVRTTWVVRVDADTMVCDDVSRAVEAIRRDGAQLCSVKTRVLDPKTIPEKMQDTEYAMSMLARHYRPWLTSGACMMGTRTALMEIYSVHSFWAVGEDVETGIIARRQKKRVRHLQFEVRTEAPDTWRALFTQRKLWWAGSFRHSVINIDNALLRNPLWTLYYAGLVWCGIYFRGHSVLSFAQVVFFVKAFPVMYLIYVGITYVSNWQVRSRWFLVFPLYSFVQTLFLPPLGLLRYSRLGLRARSTGRYQISNVPEWLVPSRDFSRLAAISTLGACSVVALRILV